MADQLGHAGPALTLRVYAHAIQDEEPDLSFADFSGSERLYASPSVTGEFEQAPNHLENLVGPRGLEPRGTFATGRDPTVFWPAAVLTTGCQQAADVTLDLRIDAQR